MAVKIFKDPEQQNLFSKQGFLVVPFLTKDEVQELDVIFDRFHPDLTAKGFFSGSYSGDFEYKKKASDEIVRIFSRRYSELFIDYTPFGGAFLCKIPGQNSELSAHQDWTIVDETKAVALNCWVPLCDITPENGPLMILPGSHFDSLNVIRCPTLPFYFSGNDDIVLPELEPMIVKAGTAVILNQSVIHYSPNNTSNNVRKAITAGIKSAGAQMFFHYKVPETNTLEVFAEDDDFLIRFDNFFQDISQRPKQGKSIGTIPYQLPKLSAEELRTIFTQMKAKAGFEMRRKEENKTQQSPDSEKSFFSTISKFFRS